MIGRRFIERSWNSLGMFLCFSVILQGMLQREPYLLCKKVPQIESATKEWTDFFKVKKELYFNLLTEPKDCFYCMNNFSKAFPWKHRTKVSCENRNFSAAMFFYGHLSFSAVWSWTGSQLQKRALILLNTPNKLQSWSGKYNRTFQ